MSNTALVPMDTNKALRMVGIIRDALCRLGFVHTDKDGRTFVPTFSAVYLYPNWLVCEIDANRLWHFSIADLSTDKVIRQLAACLGRPVKALTTNGLSYVVFLNPAPPLARLPNRVQLDLARLPAGPLIVPIGVGRDGPVTRSLPELGHCLVAGTTGSGKSTWLHCALAGLLTSNGPDRLRLVLVDPKRSELTPWANVPHLSAEVAYTPAQAARVLADVADEIDRRGELFARQAVRDVAGYNQRAAEPLSYLLVVIDEALDLVLSAESKPLAGHLRTIAVRGRSAGVRLWAATQHASAVNGLPRVVNVNLTTRLVFRVADRSAADVAGCPGAERLPFDRPGRMLAKLNAAPVELQGFYLPDEALFQVAQGVAGSAATGPALSEDEMALVRYAVTRLGGAFIVNKLAAEFEGCITHHTIRGIAERWEKRGWLTSPTHRADPRRVTPELGELAGIGAHAPSSVAHGLRVAVLEPATG